MNRFLTRSQSTSTNPSNRSQTPQPKLKSTISTPSALKSRPSTPGPSFFSPPISPSDSPTRPARPKSTLGFSSKFGLSWKGSLKSTTSTRSGGLRGKAGEVRDSASPEAVKEGDGGKEGGMRALRRRMSTEWWATPAPARPSTPAKPVVQPAVPSDKSAASDSRKKYNTANTPSRIPIRSTTPAANPSKLTALTPLRKTEQAKGAVRPTETKENPQMRAIHADWRSAARGLEGLAKACLSGAVCISLSDPLEGIKEAYMSTHAPHHRVIKSTISHPTPLRPMSSIYRPTTPTMDITTPIPKTPRASKSGSPIPHLSPSPAPRPLPRSIVSPTPLTRRPLVSRKAVDVSSARITPAVGPDLRPGLDKGVTPRSTRRMRNSLKMTPIPSVPSNGPIRNPGVNMRIPAAYIPLKSPAASPAPKISKSKPLRSANSSSLPHSHIKRTSDSSSSSDSTSSAIRVSLANSVNEGISTPPNFDKEQEVGSPWQVVKPSPAFARKYEGLQADAEWVVTSPVKRSMR